MNKKYKLDRKDKIKVCDRTLYRIVALVDIKRTVSAGERGGYVESQKNLSHDGDAWIGGNAKVFGNAKVYEQAKVSGNATVCGNAEVSGRAHVYGEAVLKQNASVYGYARVFDKAVLKDDVKVYGCAKICKSAWVHGKAEIFEDAVITHNNDFLTIENVGRADITMLFKTKNGWGVYYAFVFFDFERFHDKIKLIANCEDRKELELVLELMKHRIKTQEANHEAH